MATFLRMLGLILAASLAAGCDAASDEPARPVETAVSTELLETAMTGSLRGTVVHLNNYGAENEEEPDSWIRRGDSFVRFSAALGGAEIRFDVPEFRAERGRFRFLYYVQDVNGIGDSVRVEVAERPDTLQVVVTMPFEDEGTELKGHCLSDGFLGLSGCLGSKDRAAPDLHLSDPRLVITLEPVVQDGGLAFSPTSVRFEGEIQAGGVCNIDLGVVSFDVCDALADYRDALRSQVETLVFEQFGSEEVQHLVAAGLRPALDALGIGEVVALQVEEGRLIFVHYPYE